MKNTAKQKNGKNNAIRNQKGLRKALYIGTTALAMIFSATVYGQDKTPVVATENHVGLAVKNLDSEKAWYEKAFGMKQEQHFELPKMNVRTVLLRAPNGLGMELIEVKGATRHREYKNALDAASDLGYGHWAIVVVDLKQAYATLIAAGATSISAPGPAVQPGASFAYVKDPEGNLIEMMQLPTK